MLNTPRSTGVLLHPTSLPNSWGIGSIGPEAVKFAEFLAEAGQSIWQILPLGPTGFGNSPYTCFSAFAGNPLLISIDWLLEDKLLDPNSVLDYPDFPEDRVKFEEVVNRKNLLLAESYQRWKQSSASGLRVSYQKFCSENEEWIDDYALFMALRLKYDHKSWNQWPTPIAHRNKQSIEKATLELADEIDEQIYYQFLFDHHWRRFRKETAHTGIQIFGDIPIFVAYNSSDTWSHPDQFNLEPDGTPKVIAGVPPDYFSETGQRWGNPLYDWDQMKADDYIWWKSRFRKTFEMMDIARIDHFRGFESFWEIPAHEETAVNGQWVEGPGMDLFLSLEKEFGKMNVVAEDLGAITPEVEALVEATGFPGMKVLQFAFGDDDTNPFLPHNYPTNCVVYTGTHDNDTTRSWFEKAPEEHRKFCMKYTAARPGAVSWDLIRVALHSKAHLSMIPFQDYLSLGEAGRMNVPGVSDGNWSWRCFPSTMNESLAKSMKLLAKETNRCPASHTDE